MLSFSIATECLDSLPLGALLVKDDKGSLNHKVVFLNRQFAKEIGWTLDEIPDKDTWWLTAYPEDKYREVVARQWELCVEAYDTLGSDYITMDVNIETKFNGSTRFRVFTEAKDNLVPDHYLVLFMKL